MKKIVLDQLTLTDGHSSDKKRFSQKNLGATL